MGHTHRYKFRFEKKKQVKSPSIWSRTLNSVRIRQSGRTGNRGVTANYTRKCDPCQRLAPILKSLVQDLISISSPWPFAQWGIDIVGPLPTAPAQKKLLLVATDYFSKWIEVEALSSIKDRDVTQFIWKNIVCRFGIPRSIVSDNGPQFDNRVY